MHITQHVAGIILTILQEGTALLIVVASYELYTPTKFILSLISLKVAALAVES